ncbi:uncharacterized protein LOC115200984 [Salmo trutta]|uniref:uncharacterized protein LOC115200984 n=1 Tax=Salmo trutta TaxID=8032 RepID=UPI0011319D0E|nr:uncharacterized protein LOC115200984 [Salmo trutta]
MRKMNGVFVGFWINTENKSGQFIPCVPVALRWEWRRQDDHDCHSQYNRILTVNIREKQSRSDDGHHVCSASLSCLMVTDGTRYVTGSGLADGEQMERLWSYARTFVKITKEMTPTHLVDTLKDSLYYAARVREKQGSTQSDVEVWTSQIMQTLTDKRTLLLTWQEKRMETHTEQQSDMISLAITDDGNAQLTTQLENLEKSLKAMEKRNRIVRWPLQNCAAILESLQTTKTLCLLATIHRLVLERSFYCGLVRQPIPRC